MTYMAFDALRLRRLRAGLADTADRLARQRSTDPLAADALRAVRGAHDVVAFHWLPIVDRVEGCRALEAGGWPGVEALIPRLAAGYEALGGASATPTDVTGWAELIAAVAEQRQLAIVRGEPTEEVDATLDVLAALIDAHPRRGQLLGELSVTAEPYAVALILVRVHVNPVQFGVLSAELLRRWFSDPAVNIYTESGESLGKFLVPFVAASPLAARSLFGELGQSPEVLTGTVRSAAGVAALLDAATDPATTTPGEAARILGAVIDAYAAHPGEWEMRSPDVHWPALLANAAVPWLPLFGPRTDEAGWTADDGRRRLDVLLTNGGAEALADTEATWVAPLLSTVRQPDGALNRDAIDDLTATLAMLDDGLRRAEITMDDRDRVMLAPVVALVRQLPNLLSATNPTVQAGARVGGRVAVAALETRLREWGVLPPDKAESAARADRRWSSRTTQAGVILFVTVAEQMIAEGDLPPAARGGLDLGHLGGGCAADEVQRRMTAFIDTYAKGHAAEQLWAVRNAMLNDPTVTVACR